MTVGIGGNTAKFNIQTDCFGYVADREITDENIITVFLFYFVPNKLQLGKFFRRKKIRRLQVSIPLRSISINRTDICRKNNGRCPGEIIILSFDFQIKFSKMTRNGGNHEVFYFELHF